MESAVQSSRVFGVDLMRRFLLSVGRFFGSRCFAVEKSVFRAHRKLQHSLSPRMPNYVPVHVSVGLALWPGHEKRLW